MSTERDESASTRSTCRQRSVASSAVQLTGGAAINKFAHSLLLPLCAVLFVEQGSWSPGSNLCTVLASIQQLMAYPNANDGLVAEIVREHAASLECKRACAGYGLAHSGALSLCSCLSCLQTQHFKDNRASFDLQAREMTRRHAVANVTADPEAAASASTAASAAASNSAAAAAATQAVTATPAASVAATASVPAATASVADGSNAAADTNRALAPSPSADSSNLAPHAAIGSKRAASPNAGEDAPSDAKKQRTEQIPDTTDAAATSTSTSSPAQSVEQQS